MTVGNRSGVTPQVVDSSGQLIEPKGSGIEMTDSAAEALALFDE